MDSPQKIYPTADELSTVNSTVHCPEEGCSSIFMSESNLNLHLIKTHKKENLKALSNVVREFYCPEPSCAYNNAKSFKSLKLLKQHFLKVHGEKSFACCTCDMKFSTNAAKNSHFEYCNAKFTCCECNASYPLYESLLTHGRRKKHVILDKCQYKTNIRLSVKSNSSTNLNEKNKRTVLVLPKGSASLELIKIKKANEVCEKGSQTDIWTGRQRLSRNTIKLDNNSQETQTLNNQHLSAETQTIGDYFSKKIYGNKVENDEDRKSIKTQTKKVDSSTASCNTLFNISDYDLEMVKNTSGTQTTSIPQELIYSTSQNEQADINEFEFMHSSSQTCFDEDMDMFTSESYFNCNSETQTDFMSMLNGDYCSNMYTQTNDDNLLLNDLAFMSSHTQTVFDDILRSVESQTMMSSPSVKMALTCRDMANMETQTDVEFKQMLEEINA